MRLIAVCVLAGWPLLAGKVCEMTAFQFFPANVMPTTFASLPKGQLDALVKYLIDSSKAAK